jgi:hypothetical protein
MFTFVCGRICNKVNMVREVDRLPDTVRATTTHTKASLKDGHYLFVRFY